MRGTGNNGTEALNHLALHIHMHPCIVRIINILVLIVIWKHPPQSSPPHNDIYLTRIEVCVVTFHR